MRLVPISAVHEGNVLGQSLSDESGRILLRKGVKLSESFIRQLKTLGYDTLYIEDEYTEAEVDEVLKPKVVAEIIHMAESITKHLTQSRPNQRNLNDSINRLTSILESVLDDILGSPDAVTNLLTISNFDEFTYKHSLNCMVLAVMLGDKLNLDRESLLNLAIGSVFHDMGKFFVPKEILLKPAKLLPDEIELMQKHPREGYNYLKKASQLMPTARIMALEHHEKWDGSGYPSRKKGEDTYLHSRISAACDVFEALTANRPYRSGWSVSEARSFVIAGAGTHFDPDIVQPFSRLVNPYPLDSFVRLSDGREGVVRGVNQTLLDRPEVEIFVEGGRTVTSYMENLADSNDVLVAAVIHQFSTQAG